MARPLSRRPGFDIMSFHVRFMVDKVTNGIDRSASTSGFPSQNNSTNSPYLFSSTVALSGRTKRRDLRTFLKAMLFRKSVNIG